MRFNRVGQSRSGRSARRTLNLEVAHHHSDYEYHPLIKDTHLHGYLGVPIIQHRKLYGVLCLQQEEAQTLTTHKSFLITLAAQLGGVLAQAEANGELDALTEPNSSRSRTLR